MVLSPSRRGRSPDERYRIRPEPSQLCSFGSAPALWHVSDFVDIRLAALAARVMGRQHPGFTLVRANCPVAARLDQVAWSEI